MKATTLRAFVLACGLLCVGWMGASGARAGVNPQFEAPSFFTTQVTFGFAQPIGMAVAPDGRMFITDNAGIVWTSTGGGAKATKLFDLSDHVNEEQDRGLVSVAVDKNYAFNRHIYLAYTFEDRTQAELEGNPSLKLLSKTQRLVRVTVPSIIPAEPIQLEPEDEHVVLGSYSSDPPDPGVPFSNTQACPQPSNLVSGDWSTANATDCIPSDSVEHTIDSVRVDPDDGTLWVSVGDGAAGGSTLDTDSWRSQRNESYSGKLLHIGTDGKGLAGHPFCPSETDLTKVCTKVYAKGFRNPFRFFFRPAPDGRPTVTDAGWSTREELDLAEAGKNYGWPCREGKIATPTWSERSECTALPLSTFTEPVYDYNQIAGGAILGGVSYAGTEAPTDYPNEYKGAIFFSDYVTNQVLYLRLNPAGTAVASGYPKVFADDLQAVDWATAANGDFMYVDIGFGPSELAQIRRISYDSDNAPPEAVIEADQTYGESPLDVEFDASGSSDPDGDDLSYEWDFDEDGDTDSTDEEPEETFNGSENVEVTLSVEDEDGGEDTDTIVIYPGNEHAPDPDFDSGPSTYRDGEPIAFAGSATDGDDGTLGDSALFWNVKLDHAGTHIHAIAEEEGDDSVNFTTDTAHDAPSTYIVELTATDSRGLEVTTTRTLTPETSLVRIESAPTGAPLTFGGTNQVAPYEKQSTIGLISTLSAAPSFTSTGGLVEFAGWADGASRIRDLVVPDHNVTLTAGYRSPSGPDGEDDDTDGDKAAPRLRFNPKRGLVGGRKSVLKGTAEDPSGVRKVLVALREQQKHGSTCHWWSQQLGGFSAVHKPCSRPAFMTARVKKGKGDSVNWAVPLKGRLEKGSYLLRFKVVDGAGNVGSPRPTPLRVP